MPGTSSQGGTRQFARASAFHDLISPAESTHPVDSGDVSVFSVCDWPSPRARPQGGYKVRHFEIQAQVMACAAVLQHIIIVWHSENKDCQSRNVHACKMCTEGILGQPESMSASPVFKSPWASVSSLNFFHLGWLWLDFSCEN